MSLHYELERNVIAKWLHCHDLQFTHRELPTDDRFVQIRGFPCREREVISTARILKRKGPHLCIELNFNRATVRNIDYVESALRINEEKT